MPKRNFDLKLLVENFKDLDYLSSKVLNEYKLKNDILKGGLGDCSKCTMFIDKSQKK